MHSETHADNSRRFTSRGGFGEILFRGVLLHKPEGVTAALSMSGEVAMAVAPHGDPVIVVYDPQCMRFETVDFADVTVEVESGERRNTELSHQFLMHGHRRALTGFPSVGQPLIDDLIESVLALFPVVHAPLYILRFDDFAGDFDKNGLHRFVPSSSRSAQLPTIHITTAV